MDQEDKVFDVDNVYVAREETADGEVWRWACRTHPAGADELKVGHDAQLAAWHHLEQFHGGTDMSYGKRPTS